jgi:glycosyltransferase involved in cell wall biosynthesis
MKKKYDVLIIGELVGNDLILAEHLSRVGLRCCVVRKQETEKGKRKEIITNLSFYHTHFKESEILFVKNAFEFLKIARESRLILSATAALLYYLNFLWFLRKIIKLPPVINVGTGSDITELAADRSIKGILYRQYLRFVDLNWFGPYPHAIKNIYNLKLGNIAFMPFPYILPNETEIINFENDKVKVGPIRFFHASHLDWKINDPGEWRNSSKGNDRFIRAFAKAVSNGLVAKCIILNRGSDKDEAQKLIKELNVEKYFEWKQHLSRDEFVSEIFISDVVVDQFDIGGTGGIMIEAMSLGKPVITYINENSNKLLYTEPPPILNCYTEDEIYNQILKCSDRKFLENLGIDSKGWVIKNHHWQNCLDQFLFYFTLFTGRKIVDYGWDKKPK